MAQAYGKATQDAGSGSASHTIKPDTPRPEPGPNGQFSVDAETCGAFCRERQDRSARKISFIRARIEVAFVSASRMICTRSGSGGLPTVAISFRKRALVVAYSSQSCLSLLFRGEGGTRLLLILSIRHGSISPRVRVQSPVQSPLETARAVERKAAGADGPAAWPCVPNAATQQVW